ncbi:MAG TPA: tetratricopeptide repeat protein [Pyrinomonadaceae bacterium]|nr:tetratricopeptide repeat protein [Pyrinomonadaceae bacterium]
MNKQKILYALAGLIAGCAIGFFFANSVNRKELEELRGEVVRARNNPGGQSSPQQGDSRNANGNATDASAGASMPTEAEMSDLIKKADANPGDTEYQRKVGQGIYMYALSTGQPALMPEAVRLLKRAHEADPKNYETTVLVANSLFALAQVGDASNFGEARVYYNKALAAKPEDVNVRTLLGMTYFFGQPSDPERAIKEYRKSLATEPRQEMALQSLAAALIATGAHAEAQQRLEELQKVNPKNATLSNLRAQLAQAKNAAKEKD